jgi:Na+-driven multidrug efflux pump
LIICIYIIFSLISVPYNTFINGVGKIKLQYYTAIATIVATVPLAVLFGKYLDWGVTGVVAATLCTTAPCTILWKIQFDKINANKAKGIWNA